MKTKNKNKSHDQISTTDIKGLKDKMAAASEAKAENKNAEKTVQKIQYERELKWRYPDGITKTGERKTFRQKSRNKLRRLESRLLKITEKAAKQLAMEEIEKFRTEVLMDPKAAI